MATLDRWRDFLRTPKILRFPELRLIGRDFDPPIVTGTGEVRAPSPGEFTFMLRGLPENAEYASAAFRDQRANPYDALARFRLSGVDDQGEEWRFGWTVPRVKTERADWIFEGSLDAVFPPDETNLESKDTTEVLFLIPREHPAAYIAKYSTLKPWVTGGPVYEHTLEALGSKIHFTYEPANDALSIIATHSSDLPPTYTENWLGEPLRILFGQLVFPRLVARNLHDGRSLVCIRRCHYRLIPAGWAALWVDEVTSAGERQEFWTRAC